MFRLRLRRNARGHWRCWLFQWQAKGSIKANTHRLLIGFFTSTLKISFRRLEVYLKFHLVVHGFVNCWCQVVTREKKTVLPRHPRLLQRKETNEKEQPNRRRNAMPVPVHQWVACGTTVASVASLGGECFGHRKRPVLLSSAIRGEKWSAAGAVLYGCTALGTHGSALQLRVPCRNPWAPVLVSLVLQDPIPRCS